MGSASLSAGPFEPSQVGKGNPCCVWLAQAASRKAGPQNRVDDDFCLIERSRSTEDRRQLIVELTEEGARQAGLEQAARIKFRSEAFSALTLEEREQLLIMLNKIRNTWEGFDD